MEITPRQAVFTVTLAVLLFIFVIELVRRRHLREEYSWLWLIASGITLLLVSWRTALYAITRFSGASKATTTIFMLAVAFLAVTCVHLCTKLTSVNAQTKKLAQKLAILDARQPEEQKVLQE